MTGPFIFPDFKVNVPSTGCLKRDFTPWIMNYFAQQVLVDHVLSQPDYTSFAFAIENVPSFDQPNIHGSGHFGVGGVLGTIGDAYNSPGGKSSEIIPELSKNIHVHLTNLSSTFKIHYSTCITAIWTEFCGSGNPKTGTFV